MCGIAGSTRAETRVLEDMKGRLVHRGPDSAALWLDEDAGFGLSHTRPKVIDLSAAADQLMISDCRRYVLAYNGEIYNYRNLRRELESCVDRFCNSSDTEVLLSLLGRYGSQGIGRLGLANGGEILVADHATREACQDRDQSCSTRPVRHVSIGRGCRAEKLVPENLGPD